jgi:hypothetical protein
MALVMSTAAIALFVFLGCLVVMTVGVEKLPVVVSISSPLEYRDDVIYVKFVFCPEVQSTLDALTFLSIQKGSDPFGKAWLLSIAFAPV